MLEFAKKIQIGDDVWIGLPSFLFLSYALPLTILFLFFFFSQEEDQSFFLVSQLVTGLLLLLALLCPSSCLYI